MGRRDTGIVVDIETFITNVKRLSRWYQSLEQCLELMVLPHNVSQPLRYRRFSLFRSFYLVRNRARFNIYR
jgi:hypothetical protein